MWLYAAGMVNDEMADFEGPYEPDYLWDNEAEKRSGRGAYSFGLGKRAADPRKSFYSFGLGKRDIAIQAHRNPPVTAIDPKPAPLETGQHQ
ncbi:uncharacterized protein LOC129580745 [Paramacrobiotus metropolitanus]|uniref:uncharacterized protein LOC129580745 n=1 Tax=Paramacrobiotus metropolitanus TaxID=2943436 RepID=UPI002445D03F|nr:uncharacterized protein LOC129580745 [Paramacrobiotus metropolitanus]